MVKNESKSSLEIPSDMRDIWKFLGFLLLGPLLMSPVMVVDPFVERGGIGETSIVFTVVSAVLGICILIYRFRCAIRYIRLGDRIEVRYGMRKRIIEWKDVDELFIVRQENQVLGKPFEVYVLCLKVRQAPVNMKIDPIFALPIVKTAKSRAPYSCKIDAEIRSPRVQDHYDESPFS